MKLDRNMKHKPWRPMIPFQVPEAASASGVVAAFQNHRATVFIKETASPAFTDPSGQPQRMAHLMIQWAKGLRGDDGFFYRMKQRIKSELCGPQSEFVELGPGAWREFNDIKQTHLWVLPQGATYPLGLVPNDIDGKMAEIAGGRENVVTREDLEVFVVRHPGLAHDGGDLIEVFSSEDECKESYGDKPIPEGAVFGVEMIGDVPAESPSSAWTALAKMKVENVIAKGKVSIPEEEHPVPDLFYDKHTIEDDISPAEDDGPSAIEEHLAIASAMEEALEGRENAKVLQLRQVTKEVTGRAGAAIDAARVASEKPKIIVP
jgi:hypothetical protein